MNINIRPTATEFVDIEHRDWNTRWSIQFPEAIETADGTIRAWPTIRPNWESTGPGAWGYTWQPPVDYVQQIQALKLTTPDGGPQYTRFVSGATLRAEIIATDELVELSLTITNTSQQTLRDVTSDGGCFQARSDAFRDNDEVSRSYIHTAGEMTSMARLDRTEPIRCQYVTNPALVLKDFEWFWGETETIIDAPAMIGAVSRDGRHAVILGYEQATKAMQNADAHHHCLHSGPSFGDLKAGESVTRRGWILFGDDIHELGRELRKKIEPSDIKRAVLPAI